MGFFDWLSATAVAFTVSGNTGVAPFLTLLMVGLIAKVNPELLNMGGSVGTFLNSWPSLVALGSFTVLEFVGKCIPVVDEVVDSVMTFILPVMSSLGSLSTFGLFHMESTGGSESSSDQSNRELGVVSGALVFFQIFIVLFGIVLAFSIHGLKMLLRIIGVGWLTNCLTVLETMWIITSITMALFIRPIAIIIAAFICCGALFSIKRNLLDKHDPVAAGDNQASLANNAHAPEEDDDYVKIEEAHVIAVEASAWTK
jgi:hypothetical protein